MLATWLAVPAASDAARPRVTVIGDSVAASLLYVRDAVGLLGRGLDIRLDLRVCRRLVDPSCPYQGVTPPSAIEVVRARGSGLGRTVVMKVGYNDASARYGPQLPQVVRALRDAGVTNVVWVTLAEVRPDYAAINRVIRAAEARYRVVCVADWALASAGKPYFGGDGLHLNAAGAAALVRLVRPYVTRAVRTGSCRPQAG